MLTTLRQRFRNWLFRPKTDSGTVVLTQRRIFILPTRQGMGLGLVLILMLLGDINYNLSLGYVLTFLLAMMAVVSMLHAFRNLAQLEIRAGPAEPVFCGETAHFLLHFNSKLPRFQLCLRHENNRGICFDVPARHCEILFPLATARRGWLSAGRLTLYTRFPLGLFHAWSYLHFDTRCLIYPKPCCGAPLPFDNKGEGNRTSAGDDDFAGLRNYAPGDTPQRIAWKAYARGHDLQVKQFATQTGEELWLDFNDAPEADPDGKLARMTRWVLDAEAQGLRYGLKLPDGELAANNGTAHQRACLRRIALFELPAWSAQA